MTDVGGVMDACKRQKKLHECGWRERSPISGLLEAVGTRALLGFACLISYFLITGFLGKIYFLSRDDELLGGMWSVIATIFVYRHPYQQSMKAALTRSAATLLSFALCLVYLLLLPFHGWGMAALIGIGAIIMILAGRSEDIITTGITSTGRARLLRWRQSRERNESTKWTRHP
jgi:peptidoglycan/LPS O-acetylase OafA/YrhL